MKKDCVSEIIKYCEKRENVLKEGLPISKYNYYFKKMQQYAQQLIDDGQQDRLLPYLKSDSISVRKDVADILFKYHPDICKPVLKEIAQMTVPNGLPKHLVMVAVSASIALEYGEPKNYQ